MAENFWNKRYAAPGFLFGVTPAKFLFDSSAYLKRGQTALAVADGEGRNSVYLAEKGLQVTAVDSSDVAVDKARGLAAARGAAVDFHIADLKDWDWDAAQYDVVAAIFIQFAGPGFRAQIFSGLQNALKPGGILLLHGYTPEQIELGTGGPPYVENMYTKDMLEDAFGELDILRLSSYRRAVDEGRGHSGMSALIDLVARKPG